MTWKVVLKGLQNESFSHLSARFWGKKDSFCVIKRTTAIRYVRVKDEALDTKEWQKLTQGIICVHLGVAILTLCTVVAVTLNECGFKKKAGPGPASDAGVGEPERGVGRKLTRILSLFIWSSGLTKVDSGQRTN